MNNKTIAIIVAGGVLTVLTILGLAKIYPSFREIIVSVLKEAYRIQEWTTEQIERIIEDVEDLLAEAKYAYEKEMEEKAKDKASKPNNTVENLKPTPT